MLTSAGGNYGRLWARTGCTRITTLPPCASATQCPVGIDYIHCTGGPAVGGCRNFTSGPFPYIGCTGQCVAPANPARPQASYSIPFFTCQTGDCGAEHCLLSGSSLASLFEW